MTYEYRVTKYNPTLRDAAGAHKRDEWTTASDVGRLFAGVAVTREEYDRIEDAYVISALAFLRESGLSSLRVEGLENRRAQKLEFGEGSVMPLDKVGDVIRRVLREEFWCRLEGVGAFVHIGRDYYMYIGASHPCLEAQATATKSGLYVEEFGSPYHPEQF